MPTPLRRTAYGALLRDHNRQLVATLTSMNSAPFAGATPNQSPAYVLPLPGLYYVSFFEYLEKIELYCSKENHNLKACRLKLFCVLRGALQLPRGPNRFHFQRAGTQPKAKYSSWQDALSGALALHWLLPNQSCLPGLALLLLGVLVLRSAKQACVQPSKSRAHEASAGLYVPSTQLDNSQSNCLIGVNHRRHDVPVSQQRNSPQKMAQSAYDYPQVVSVQTLITEACFLWAAGHLYPSETQLLETRCVNLSQGTVLMKAASESDGRCSQQRLSTEGSPLPERRTNMSLSLSNSSLAVCCEIGGLTLPVRSSTVSNNEASYQHTLSGLHTRGTEGSSSPARSSIVNTSHFQGALLSGWLRGLEGSASPVRPLPAPCPAGKHGSSLCVPRSWLLHQSARAQPGPQQPRVGGTVAHPNLHNHSPQPLQVGSVCTFCHMAWD